MKEEETSSLKGKSVETSVSSAHDISSLADLPGKKIKTKLWPMSPVRSLSAEEVLAIANRDETPVMIGVVLDGEDKGEKYVCANKKGASVPPDIAVEGSWAKKYYQQVVVLNDTMKDMLDRYQPVWDLTKGQQALSVSVELFDGLMAVANQGFQTNYMSWTLQDRQSIITKDCDFKSPHYATYYSVLRNFTLGNFASLNAQGIQFVEDLLDMGEQHIGSHAQLNGFNCPKDIRSLFQKFLPLKNDRNSYSHPLTLAPEPLANSVLQKLRIAITNDEIEFMKDCKDLILLGTDYGESVLHNYGKIKDSLFLDPNKHTYRPIPTSPPSPASSSPPHSPVRPSSPQFPLFGTQNASSSQGQASQGLPPSNSSLNPNALQFVPSNFQSSSSLPSSQSSPSPGSSPTSPVGAAQNPPKQPQQISNSPGSLPNSPMHAQNPPQLPQQSSNSPGSSPSLPTSAAQNPPKQPPQQSSNSPGKQPQQGSQNSIPQQPQQGSNNLGKRQRKGSQSPPTQQSQQGSYSPGKQQHQTQQKQRAATQQWQQVSHNPGNQQQQGSQSPPGQPQPGNPGNQQPQQGPQGTSSQQSSQSNSPPRGSKRPGSQSGQNTPNKR